MSKFQDYLEAAKPKNNRMPKFQSISSLKEKFAAQFPGQSETYIKNMWEKINHAMCKTNAEINDGYPHGIKRWLKSKGVK